MRYSIPYKAKALLRKKYSFPDGALVEMKAWAVPPSVRTPEGIKYSFVYIDPQGRRVLGFDNAEGKGHHRHDRHHETPVAFETVDRLAMIFLKEVEAIRGGRP